MSSSFQVSADALKRQNFAKNAAAFCARHGFDGLDLDWEYPGRREGSSASDRQNFVLLVKELRKEFDKTGLLISAAVSSVEFSASISYDIPNLSRFDERSESIYCK